MAFAGYPTTVKAGGPSTVITAEVMTEVTEGLVYQITDTAKRILDPSVAVVVNVDADGGGGGAPAVATATGYTVDYLFGKITFDAALATDATVTVTGAYLTPVSVAEAKEVDLNFVRTLAETTAFAAAGYKTRIATHKDFSGSLMSLTPLQTDLDAGGGSTILSTKYTGGTPFILEVDFGGAGTYFRGWVLIDTVDEKVTPEGIYEGSIKFQSAPVAGTGQTEAALFGFGT